MSPEEKKIAELEKELQKYRMNLIVMQEKIGELLMITRMFYTQPEDEDEVQKLIKKIPLNVQRSITKPMVDLYHVIPLRLEGNTLTIATDHPEKTSDLGELCEILKLKIKPLHCSTKTLDEAIKRYRNHLG